MTQDDQAAWRRQQIQDREHAWAMHEANGVLSAACRACGWPLLVTWGKGSTEAELRALDEHRREHWHPVASNLGAHGQSVSDSIAHAVLAKVGMLCRCVKCCCPPGKGHNHPAWLEYQRQQREDEEEQAAVARYDQAKRDGLSEAEAREEGWPTICRPEFDWHTTPHVGCILR